jgi:pimeloyl-ACP methyl ester carboxylesterase
VQYTTTIGVALGLASIATLAYSHRSGRTTTPAGAAPVGESVLSKDGTSIAFQRTGSGPAVILIDGALCYRGMGETAGLADLLAPDLTVYTYDRRGRGRSGNTLPYAVDREVEDIEALVQAAGNRVSLWGTSSGAVLALEAARRIRGVERVALYEAPFIVDDSRPTTEDDWRRIDAAVAAGHRTEAVKTFLQSVGMPWYVITPLRLLPMWPKLEAVAHTLPYDGAIVKDLQRGRPLPANSWATVAVPTLVMAGTKSPDWMQHGNESLARVLPNAQYRALDGQTHVLKPQAHAGILREFFAPAHGRDEH